jgi:CheY-like chemotaxis protein
MTGLLRVLVIDDNPGEAWEATRGSVHGAWRFLSATAAAGVIAHLRVFFSERDADDLPDILVLGYAEINDNVEVLAAIRSERWLDHLPVLVLTTDAIPGDSRQLYRHGANVVYPRPSDAEEFECLLGAILDHWQTVVAA